ncbi:hypothetical protein NLI96_g3159 [Meripilus lineatus]|uniref:Uncharacterized protein n=1 Tax=Meripilus lineatus TaxID=2056292 RepID=A0AAD5YFW4_9APHY|nr:hypothetical protein NLI96_g3159 [Physisporinus lineatus]
MPPKPQPKNYVLLLKTHKLTVLLNAPQTSTVASLKADALSALQAPVLSNPIPPSELDESLMDVDRPDSDEWKVPSVQDLNSFELCRALKERNRPTGNYEMLNDKATIKESLVNWEHVFVRFRDENGELQPVKVLQPALVEEDDEEEQYAQALAAARKGKRKAAESVDV